MKSISLLLYILLCFPFGSLFSQVSFVVRVNSKSIGINESLRLEYEMNVDGDNFQRPDFEDFDVVGGPNQSVSRSWTNGKSSYRKKITYILSPRATGSYKIGQASIEYEGETYKTEPFNIVVTSAVNTNNIGSKASVAAQARDKVHLVAIVSDKNPYLNQAVGVEYRLYWDQGVGINVPQEVDIPQFKDFWSQSIDIQELKVKAGKFNNQIASYVVVRKVVLYPQKTGTLELTPITLSVPIIVQTDRRDFFGRRTQKTITRNISAGSTKIKVRPLPKGAPKSFTGAVGTFKFKAIPSRTRLKATESLQLKLEASGTGNLKLFSLPKLELPNTLEVYDPEHKASVSTRITGLKGKVSDTYTIVPQYKGIFPIKNIAFSYFDPVLEKYQTKTISSIKLNVTEGPIFSTNTSTSMVANATDSINNSQQNILKPATVPIKAFTFIKTSTDLQSNESDIFFNSWRFWCSYLGPLLLIPLGLFFTKKQQDFANDHERKRSRNAQKLVKKHLSEAKKNLGNSKTFYKSLDVALRNFLKAKFHVVTSDMHKEGIATLLKEKQLDNQIITSFLDVLENCEMANYAPVSMQGMDADYKKASELITAIDKHL